jgi:hypothetical protein
MIKFVAVLFGLKLFQLNFKGSDDFWQACYLALFSIVTEIIPLILVIDGHFVRIMSGDHLQADTTNAESLLA